jgi:hypothetical protein
MIAPQQHIIRRQLLEVEMVGTEREAAQWQRQLATYAKDVLPSQLSNVLDKLAPHGQVLHLDRLQLEVNLPLGEADWEAFLTKEIIKGLLRLGMIEQQSGLLTDDMEADAAAMTREQSVMEHFLYFLENGRLPWNASEQLRAGLEMAVMEAVQLHPGQGGFWIKLKALLSNNEVARRRLALQFSEENLLILAKSLYPAGHVGLLGSLRQMGELASRSGLGRDDWEAVFWSFVFEEEMEVSGLPGKVAAELAVAHTWVKEKIKEVAGALGIELQEASAAAVELSKTTEETATVGDVMEGIYLENAGLVLVAPFLPGFFQELGLAEGNKLIKPAQALHLLQYLATGQEGAAEHLLPLNKLLCGLPIGEPLRKRIRFTKKEKEESRQLLESVVEHWAALKNTSPEGLQATFLQRKGKLSKGEWGWQLQVEQHPVDVLLEHLPWGIGVVKLPWMEVVLRVEWTL